MDDPEFTSVCPKTGLPDFGALTVRYMPRQRCLELKSMKEYLFTYRNLGIFQENVVNRVLEDVVKACEPVTGLSSKGEFRPRGGISTTIEARWPRPRILESLWRLAIPVTPTPEASPHGTVISLTFALVVTRITGEHHDGTPRGDESIHPFVEDQPSQEDGHHRIHVRVGRYL